MIEILRGDPLTWQLGGDTAVTIGVFDGVHLGHQAVMRQMVSGARSSGLIPVALTFDPHPLEFIAPQRAPKLLTSVDQRAEYLAECGVEVLGVLAFLDIRDLAPAAFADEILHRRCLARTVTVGADFRFGRDRSGDVQDLVEQGKRLGFEVRVVDMVVDGEVVSSTAIRGLLAAGSVQEARRLLGRPFELRGRVIHGDGRGHGIGFPTANLHVPERMAVPADGVYVARSRIGEVERPSLVNIGIRPTFGMSSLTIEVHVLDFEGDLYGKEVAVRFVARIRDERRFESVAELVAQLKADVSVGRRMLESHDG